MLKSILFLVLLPLCALAEDVSIRDAASSEKKCASDICFPEATLIAANKVPLRNIKKKKYLVFNLYVAALYVGDGITGVDGVLGDTPKKLVFRYLRDFTKEMLIENADKVLAKNPEIDLPALKSRIDQINLGYAEGIREGDVYELEYQPGRGSTLIRNGKEFTTVPGLDFAKGYLGIWLSKYPMSEDLRDSLIRIK